MKLEEIVHRIRSIITTMSSSIVELYFFVFHMLIIIMLCLGHIIVLQKKSCFLSWICLEERSFLFMAHNKTLMGGHFADFNIFEYLATCPWRNNFYLARYFVLIIQTWFCWVWMTLVIQKNKTLLESCLHFTNSLVFSS